MILPNPNLLLPGLLLVTVLTGCATGKLKEVPAALPAERPAKVQLDINWWHILGDEQAQPALGVIKPVIDNELAYIALPQGEIYAASATGEIRLLGDHGSRISAPPALDEQQLLLADEGGDITLYDLNLQPLWSQSLNALAVEQPLMTAQRLFVQTIDGRLNALERNTGRLLWSYADAEPPLTLLGTSSPVLVTSGGAEAVVTGLANGKLIALNVVDGSPIWEYRITRASGKTDISRLVDVDAKATLVDGRLAIASYQGDLVVIETASGAVVQAVDFSSVRSIVSDKQSWYGVNAASHVVALNPSTLQQRWVNTDFEYRQLSELALLDSNLLVTDKAGYLHVLAAESGEWLGSRHIDWRGANTDPVPFAGGVLVQGSSTRLKHVQIVTD